jgi:hypothetical protein
VDNLTIIPGFLDPEECELFGKLADDLVFDDGRQGTGYYKAPLPDLDFIRALRKEALYLLNVTEPHGYDCYLLKYPEGSHIPPHKDDAPFGTQHRRLNAIVEAGEGGVLIIDNQPITLNQFDAYTFRPDLLLHEVTTITKGTRLVFTVGVLI